MSFVGIAGLAQPHSPAHYPELPTDRTYDLRISHRSILLILKSVDNNLSRRNQA